MKVILLTDVPKVGNRHQIKDLKDGFAQNVLIAKGLAVMATPKAMIDLEKRKSEISQKKQTEMQVFESIISTINNKKIEIKIKANEKGHLFKAVKESDVVKAIRDITGIEIEEYLVQMDHIKELGSHTIKIKKGDRAGNCEIIIVR
jgi:large subunit ribosomal protein L9